MTPSGEGAAVPWKTQSVTEARNAFIDAYLELEEEGSFLGLCAAHGISRKTGYKWVERYDQGGRKGLEDRSKAPRHCPHSTAEEVIELVVEARKSYPFWGPRKLKAYLEREHRRLTFPAASTIGRVLKDRGLVRPQKREKKAPPYGAPLRDYDKPNRVWCADFKGPVRLKNKGVCNPLTISDGFSRYLLRCQAVRRMDYEAVFPVFEAAFTEFGLPEVIRTDNGPPFASRAPGGLSRLALWWMKLGIVPERITPGKPTQNGRHERLHRTLKLEACGLPRKTWAAQQRAFDEFSCRYNDVRPHEALSNRCPRDLYRKSARRYPRPLNEPDYDPGHDVRRVRASGEFKWRGRLVFISETLRGERIGLRWRDERGAWAVTYGDLLLGHVDSEGRLHRPK